MSGLVFISREIKITSFSYNILKSKKRRAKKISLMHPFKNSYPKLEKEHFKQFIFCSNKNILSRLELFSPKIQFTKKKSCKELNFFFLFRFQIINSSVRV